MPRYIDADAQIEKIQETICTKCGDIYDGIKCKSCEIDDALSFLENAPTADVVPRAKYEELQHKYKLAVAEREANVKGFAEDINVLAKETARKLCCEIEEEICAALDSNYKALRTYDDGRNNDYILELVGRIKGKIDALRGIEAFVEDLKEKYTKGGEGEWLNC